MVGFLSQLTIISKWYAIQKTTVLRETTLLAQSLYTIRDTKTTVPYRLFSLARDSRVRQNKTGHHPTEAASGTLAFPPKFPEVGCFHGYFLKIRENVFVMFNEICQIHRLHRNKSSSKIHCPCICFVLHSCPKYRYFCRKIIPFSPTVGGPSAVFSLCLLRHLIIKFPHLHLYQILT